MIWEHDNDGGDDNGYIFFTLNHPIKEWNI